MKIIAPFYNPVLQITFVSWKEVYQMPEAVLYAVEYHNGSLHYRRKGNPNRISYKKLKKGLVRKAICIEDPLLF